MTWWGRWRRADPEPETRLEALRSLLKLSKDEEQKEETKSFARVVPLRLFVRTGSTASSNRR
jgi:hypothetical protein